MKKMTVEQAMNRLKLAFAEDPGYAITWHCNLAIAYYDSMDEDVLSHEMRHKISNEAASRFMKNAFNIDTSC